MSKILVHSYDDRSFKDKGKNTYNYAISKALSEQ